MENQQNHNEDIEQIKKDLSELKKILTNSQKDFLHHKRPFDIVLLPSAGIFYPEKNNFLSIGHLTYYEELLLVNPYFSQNLYLLYQVLDRIIIENNFNIKDLIAEDVYAISLFLSSRSYGDSREIQVECPKCGFKNEKFKFNMSSFQFKDFNPIVNKDNEIEVEVKRYGHKLKIKPKSFLEEFEFNKNSNNTNTQKALFHVTELNEERNKDKMVHILKNMKIIEAREVKKAIQDSLPSISAEIEYNCPSCLEDTKTNFGSVNGIDFLKLPPSYKANMDEEVFLLSYYGASEGSALSIDDIQSMPVMRRKHFLSRVNAEKEKRAAAEKSEMSKAKSKSKSRQ